MKDVYEKQFLVWAGVMSLTLAAMRVVFGFETTVISALTIVVAMIIVGDK